MNGDRPATHQPAGNYYDKYNTRNPIARYLMDGFMVSFDSLVSLAGKPARAFEVGCGEGELSMRLARQGIAVSGVDVAEKAVAEARARSAQAGLGIPFFTGSIYDLEVSANRADLVVCCEVLEHLEDTGAALDKLWHLANHMLIVSVPREPIWRMLNLARGKYVTQFGNTPGHIQHWSTGRFLRLLESKFRILEYRTPLPWTMALCEPRR